MRALLGAALAAATLCPAAPLEAQTWRTLTQARRHMGEDTVSVHVRFGVGDLVIRPVDGATLYRVGLRYDEDKFDPDVHYDAARGRLTAHVATRKGRGLDYRGDQQRLELGLSRVVPARLAVEFGAAEADLDLGGLPLTDISIETGASETTVRFGEANPVSCQRMRFKVGAAEFRAVSMGNARCDRIDVDAGVGDLRLDLTGDWHPGEHRVTVDVGLGGVEIRLPREVGVRFQQHRFLASVDRPAGFTKRGSYYYSENYDEAEVKLFVHVSATFGSIDVKWAN